MIVVADTTPLNYLVLIGKIELLPRLYASVVIPEQVHLELQHPKSPLSIRAWASSLPGWCEVRSPSSISAAVLDELDPGERDAIQLALDCGIKTLLIDDSEGRRLAARLHLDVVGTVAVLERAAQLRLVDFREALQRLEQTNFRLSARVRDEFIRRNS